MHIKGREVTVTEITRQQNFKESSCKCYDSLPKAKDKCLHLVTPATIKEEWCLMGLFEFWKLHIHHLDVSSLYTKL